MNSPYRISTDRQEFDIELIHDFLAKSYWAKGLPRTLMQRSITNSLCFAAFYEKSQVGFARVITDRATFAYLADVFVMEPHRGKGVAGKMIEAILAHPELQGLRRRLLATRDAHGLYAKYGFTPLASPESFMEIHVSNAYGQP